MFTNINSQAGVQAVLAGFQSIHAAVSSAHQVNTLSAQAVLPPGNEEASANATAQMLTRVEDFASKFDQGLMYMEEFLMNLEQVHAGYNVTDAGNAASMMMAMGTDF